MYNGQCLNVSTGVVQSHTSRARQIMERSRGGEYRAKGSGGDCGEVSKLGSAHWC